MGVLVLNVILSAKTAISGYWMKKFHVALVMLFVALSVHVTFQ